MLLFFSKGIVPKTERAYHHETRKFFVPSRTVSDSDAVVWVMRDDVDGDLRSTEVLHISFVRLVVIHKAPGLLDRVGRCLQ